MGRAFEYRKAAKLKRWGHMAKTFTRLGKQIAIAILIYFLICSYYLFFSPQITQINTDSFNSLII